MKNKLADKSIDSEVGHGYKGEPKSLKAFDYDTQKWVEGPEAKKVLIKQLNKEIEILSDPSRAKSYLASTGSSDTPEQALAAALKKLGDLE